MVFEYPNTPHIRRHGPIGYINYQAFKPWLRDEFVFRCVYCLARETWAFVSGLGAFHVDHVIPQSHASDRICDYENLVYACSRCNTLKRAARLLDPCDEAFARHIRMCDDATMEGLTQGGRELIRTLHLNSRAPLSARTAILSILKTLDSVTNKETIRLKHMFFGFPEDLPDLQKLAPPGNNRPDGVLKSYYALRKHGRLPLDY